MAKNLLTAWQRLVNLLSLDKKDVLQVFYYAIFAGLVNLSLPTTTQKPPHCEEHAGRLHSDYLSWFQDLAHCSFSLFTIYHLA